MKKVLSVLLVVALCLCMFSLAGCGEEEVLNTYTEDEVVGDEIVDSGSEETTADKKDENADENTDETTVEKKTIGEETDGNGTGDQKTGEQESGQSGNTGNGGNQTSQKQNAGDEAGQNTSNAGEATSYNETVTDEVVESGSTGTDSGQTKSGTKNNNSSASGGTTAKSTKKANAGELAVFENVPEELKGTTVKFATWIDHKSCDYAHVFSDFEKLTGIKVQIVPIPQTEYIVKLMGMKASGTAPDVIVDNFEFPRTLALLQPLTVEKTGINVKDAVWDQDVAKIYTIGGKCYAITGSNSNWEMASPLTYYNIPLLKKYGIKTPADYVKDNNWTLDTMKKCAEDCKDAGIFTPCEIDVAVFSNVYGDGPYHYDAATAKYSNTMGTSKFRQMWNMLADLREKGLAKLSNTWASSLTSGETGFVISGAYGLRKQPGWFYQMDSDDIGYAYLPKEKKADSQYPTSTFARGYGIADGAKNPKGAGYFLRYFLNDDWYEDDEIFKDSRAAQMHHDLLKIKNFSHPELNGIVMTQYEDYKAFYNDLTTSTPQQVAANIDKVSQKMDYCVKKANALIDAAR